MTQDSETVDVYNRQAGKYADMFANGDAEPRLTAFIAKLPAGGKVLDLGCGPGAHSALMREAGLQVSSIDASAAMAALAKQRFDIDVRVATFDDIDYTDEFDGVWASFSLLHAPRSTMPRHLNALHQALRTDGQIFLGLKTGVGAHRDSIGRLYTYYAETEIRALLEASGFTVTNSEIGMGVGLEGIPTSWIVLTAHA